MREPGATTPAHRRYTAPARRLGLRRPTACHDRLICRAPPHPGVPASCASFGLVAGTGVRRAAPLPQGLRVSGSVEGITEYRLANGLQVLLAPDDCKPTTTVNVTYRVGSRHENYGETGMAHLLEHLLFKGTPTHPQRSGPSSPSAACAPTARPGSTAPTTSPASPPTTTTCSWYLGWQADAMVNSFIAQQGPRHRDDGGAQRDGDAARTTPSRILLQRTLATMYDWHNYGKRHDRRAQRRRKRRHRPPAGVLPQLLPARQRDADRLRQVRPGTDAAAGSPRPSARSPKPTRTLPRLYTLEPAQDGERSVTLRRVGGTPMLIARLPRAGRLASRLSGGRAAGRSSATRPRAGCTSGWSRRSSRPACRRRGPGDWPTPASLLRRAARAGAGSVEPARAELLADARVVAARAGHRRGAGSAPRPSG